MVRYRIENEFKHKTPPCRAGSFSYQNLAYADELLEMTTEKKTNEKKATEEESQKDNEHDDKHKGSAVQPSGETGDSRSKRRLVDKKKYHPLRKLQQGTETMYKDVRRKVKKRQSKKAAYNGREKSEFEPNEKHHGRLSTNDAGLRRRKVKHDSDNSTDLDNDRDIEKRRLLKKKSKRFKGKPGIASRARRLFGDLERQASGYEKFDRDSLYELSYGKLEKYEDTRQKARLDEMATNGMPYKVRLIQAENPGIRWVVSIGLLTLTLLFFSTWGATLFYVLHPAEVGKKDLLPK